MTFLTFTETSSPVIPSLLFLLLVMITIHPVAFTNPSQLSVRTHMLFCVCARVPLGSLVRRASRKCDHHLMSCEVLFPLFTHATTHTYASMFYEAFQHLSSTVRRTWLPPPHAAFLFFHSAPPSLSLFISLPSPHHPFLSAFTSISL